jgi:hypothetical protein
MNNTQNSKFQKDWWDKSKIVINVLALIIVPGVITYYGNSINSTLKEMEIKVKYVEIAAGILSEKPGEETNALRDWAIKVIDSCSIVPLGPNAIEELRRNPMPGSGYLTDEKGNIYTDERGEPYIGR